jgi:hypothetical protein
MTDTHTADAGIATHTPSQTKALTYVPQIKEAHTKVLVAERGGYKSALEHAITCGRLLTDAKETVGHTKWKEWRETYIPDLKQTTASLYMRLYKHEDLLKKPNREISNGLLTAEKEGSLSIRKASALLPKKEQRGNSRSKPTGQEKADTPKPEEVTKEFLKPLAVDELAIFLRGIFDPEYLGQLAKALAPPLERRV